MKLYELVGRDKTKGFSPFVWRIKMALAHKGLDYELVPLHFTEIKDALSFADSKTVPVLVDGDHAVSDSWDIACYLEDRYPGKPSLFNDRPAAKLFHYQLAQTLLMPLFRTIVADIFKVIDDQDKEYFRATREPRIKCTIEQAGEDLEESLMIFKGNLWPYSQFFKSDDYIGGDNPVYQDYALYGMFLWARATSSKKIVDDEDPIANWIMRMDQCFGGIGGQVQKIK